MSRTEMRAQSIILSRTGAIEVDQAGNSHLTEHFINHAANFRQLREKGLNYIQIDDKLRKELYAGN